VGAPLRKAGGIPVLAGQAPLWQTVGSLLTPSKPTLLAKKFIKKESLMNSLQLKNTLNYFLLNAFGKVKNLTK
jgi:hypothetical protein